jgi:hypothetical protein
LEGSWHASSDQHRVTVAVEAITTIGSFSIRAAREVDPRKGHHQSQPSRTGKMKIRDQVIDDSESIWLANE